LPGRLLEKRRHPFACAGHVFGIDVFAGPLAEARRLLAEP
jgi:CYTH domain-containing protein